MTRLTALIQRHPTFGYRRLWAILRFRDGPRITPKTVYRFCALKHGWAHLAAVIDCHDRELIGHEFAVCERAKEAERALKGACLGRFGTLRPAGATPVVRSACWKLLVKLHASSPPLPTPLGGPIE